jgi:hypothetical protein
MGKNSIVPPEQKYKEIVEEIKEEEDVEKKVDGVAMLLFTIINNDLTCSEVRQLKMDKKLNKILVLLIAAIVLFVALNPGSLGLILNIVKIIFAA